MKKIIALAIAVLMLAALAVPAFAAAGSDTINATGDTTVTYTVGNSYVLTVPANITVGGAAGKIAVSEYNVITAKKVSVAATSEEGFVLTTTNGDTEGTYTYELNSNTFTFTADGEQDVTATWADEVTAPTVAGDYSDIVTFTATIVAA